ncbi:hypothetical protein VQ056_16565 [Paenibacillus sp. JTLBN-2024]
MNTAAAGPNLSVHFTATVTLSAIVSVLVPITITIFRVVGGVSTLVYSATQSLPVGTLLLTTEVITVTGIDLLTTNPGFVVYQAFVSIPGGLAVIPTRVGPESPKPWLTPTNSKALKRTGITGTDVPVIFLSEISEHSA